MDTDDDIPVANAEEQETMKIQSPAILAIGLVASLTTAISGSFSPSGAAAAIDRALATRSIIEGRQSVVERSRADDVGRPSPALPGAGYDLPYR